MDFGLSGKVAMVAAASKGIGLAAGKALAAEGCRVSICARGEEDLARAVQQIPNAIGVRCDVSNAAELAAWHAATTKQLGPASILVTNTGGPPAGAVSSMSDEQWQQGFDTTILNVVRLVRLVAPDMIAAGWGRIVHITSLVAYSLNELLPISTTLRAGLRGLTKAQAVELGGAGITVNSVLPGHTKTDRQLHLAKVAHSSSGISEDEYFAGIAAEIPVGRIADPEAIAAPIAFLCSNDAWFVNGVSLLVDGGMTRAV